MNLKKQILTRNDCYRAGRTIKVKGVMVHSTGANNPNTSRYTTAWDKPGVQKCVHAFVGYLPGDAMLRTVGTVQTLPWDRRGWHAGGNANNTHIGFEICEDGLEDPVYFQAVYREAVELTAYLCKLYGLDPLADGVVICHSEGHKRGIASNHADVMHWFPRFGKTMDDFRLDVAEEMEDNDMNKQDCEKMIQEAVAAALPVYGTVNDVPTWYRPTIEKLVDAEALRGTDPTGTALNVSEGFCRIMTVLDRMGKLD